MEMEKGTPSLRYETVGRIPIQIAIPMELTVLEAKAALEEFTGFLAELAKRLPDADTVPLGVAYKILSDLSKK